MERKTITSDWLGYNRNPIYIFSYSINIGGTNSSVLGTVLGPEDVSVNDTTQTWPLPLWGVPSHYNMSQLRVHTTIEA